MTLGSLSLLQHPQEGDLSFAPKANEAIGCFRHKDTNAFFEYSSAIPPDADELEKGFIGILFPDFPHRIFMSDDSVRYATVAKTVAYVCVDEDADGNFVIEKWKIKQHKEYK
jgi:hypothetical protein